MKKQLLFLITLCMSMLGFSQTVGDTFMDNYITYEVTSVSPYEVEAHDYDHNNGSTDVVIPTSVIDNGTMYSVTSIGYTAFENNGPSNLDVTSVIIPNSITSIGNEAFSSQNLTTVTIPNSVTSIGDSAFSNNDLTTASIGNGVISIGQNAFVTNQLTTIVIPDSVTSIGQFAFSANQLTSATLSNSLTTIEWGTFQSNQLQSIIIPNNVTSIGNGAFNSNQLTNVTLSNSLITIGNNAFRGNNLTHVTIPSTVTDIDFAAFRDNFNLATVTSQGVTPANIAVPGINDSFYNRAAIDLTIPSGTAAAYAAGGWTGFNSVTEASALAVGDTFVVDYITYEVTSISPDTVEAIDYNMAGGTVVNIPANVSYSVSNYNVTSVGNQAFSDKGLTEVSIPNSITSMGSGAFGINQLTNITIPNSISSISFAAFNHNLLTSVIIPANITNIDLLAFANNPLNTVISLNTTPPTIPSSGTNDAFNSGRENINLIITNNTTDVYVNDPGALWTGFKMVFEATSPTTVEVSNYDPANGTNVIIPADVTVDSIVFNVVKIDDSAFENIGLTSVIIPDSVTEIGISAFELNNLTSVTIPDSVTHIHTTAFAQNSISNLSLGNNVNDIGIGAFVDNSLSDVTIPSNVTFIGLLAFGNNPLTDVTSLAATPPTITTGTNDTFAFNRGNIHLHIPAGTMGAYVTDIGALWTGFNPVTEDALSTENFELENSVKVFTTANGIEIITSNSTRLENYTIYSITGAKITNGISNLIPTDSFASGIYILKLDFDKGTITKKIAIK